MYLIKVLFFYVNTKCPQAFKISEVHFKVKISTDKYSDNYSKNLNFII